MNPSIITQRLLRYAVLARLHKPIGIFLLLWPTWWALWLANQGMPSWHILWIFTLGVIVMRSAGCVINDIADRHIDSHISRTQQRPLACHVVSIREALILFTLLLALGLLLLLQLNRLAILCGIAAASLTLFYPFSKRYTHFPQVILGLTFYAGIPMAFAASVNHFTPLTGWLYLTAALWALIFDTFYAMVDRPDDLKIGVKSTAVFFGKYDRFILACLQILWISLLCYIGILAELNKFYYIAVLIAALLCGYHQKLIYHRQPEKCFRAFLHNNWIGMVIFLGIFLSYLLPN